MGLEIPNLDQKDFASFREEALAKLPSYCSQWSEYNISDPGITIVELLSWMGDINGYRLNHLGEEHYQAFLALLGTKTGENESIQEAFLNYGKDLALPSKAVTLQDYEYLALQTKDLNDNNEEVLVLAKCRAMVDKDSENQVSVLIVPHSEGNSPQPTAELIDKVELLLDEKRLLTTRVKMIETVAYVPVNVHLKVKTRYADPDLLKEEIQILLQRFLHPLYGGLNGQGWEFGEDIHISHIYSLLTKVKGIEKIDEIYFSSSHAVKVSVAEMSLPNSGNHKLSVESIKVLGVCHGK